MSEDTPQNDESTNEVVSEVIETNDSAVASDTTTPVEGESEQQVDEVAVAQEKANAAFNKQYGEKKQLERDLAAQREVNAKFEQAERERQAAAVGDIPNLPDRFDFDTDEEFNAANKRRDDAIIAQTNYTASNNAYLQQQQLNQQQAAQAKAKQFNESVNSYTSKAVELGIKQEELKAAGDAVAGYGLSDDLVMHILSDSDGPLITKHLAANPQDGYQLAQMGFSPAAGNFLNDIKAKASALRPKTSSTPAPATNLTGNGVDSEAGKYKYIGGSTIDIGAKWQ